MRNCFSRVIVRVFSLSNNAFSINNVGRYDFIFELKSREKNWFIYLFSFRYCQFLKSQWKLTFWYIIYKFSFWKNEDKRVLFDPPSRYFSQFLKNVRQLFSCLDRNFHPHACEFESRIKFFPPYLFKTFLFG